MCPQFEFDSSFFFCQDRKRPKQREKKEREKDASGLTDHSLEKANEKKEDGCDLDRLYCMCVISELSGLVNDTGQADRRELIKKNVEGRNE